MRTTINIKKELMDALLEYTKAGTKTKPVEVAIKDSLEKKSIERLIPLSGKIKIDTDWPEDEEREVHEYADHRRHVHPGRVL